MSVICQNFVQNAWKKDLCSNCFKSVGDHDQGTDLEQVPNGDSNHGATIEDDDSAENKRYISQATAIYPSRTSNTPQTTWKSLINKKNGDNSQPFKLETGFRGRLLTINTAVNVFEKKNVKSSVLTNGTKPSNKTLTEANKHKNGFHQTEGCTNGVNKQEYPETANINSTVNAKAKLRTEIGSSGCGYDSRSTANKGSVANSLNGIPNAKELSTAGCENEVKKKEFNLNRVSHMKPNLLEQYQNGYLKKGHSKLVKANSDVIEVKSSQIHGILKKSVSSPNSSSSNQSRRGSVGFREEEPEVIGYGGRDFSPEELEWDMGSSDGEGGSTSDSLDETEDDKTFSKITKKNTEFNSDTANLLLICDTKKNETESNISNRTNLKNDVYNGTTVNELVSDTNKTTSTGGQKNSEVKVYVSKQAEQVRTENKKASGKSSDLTLSQQKNGEFANSSKVTSANNKNKLIQDLSDNKNSEEETCKDSSKNNVEHKQNLDKPEMTVMQQREQDKKVNKKHQPTKNNKEANVYSQKNRKERVNAEIKSVKTDETNHSTQIIDAPEEEETNDVFTLPDHTEVAPSAAPNDGGDQNNTAATNGASVASKYGKAVVVKNSNKGRVVLQSESSKATKPERDGNTCAKTFLCESNWDKPSNCEDQHIHQAINTTLTNRHDIDRDSCGFNKNSSAKTSEVDDITSMPVQDETSISSVNNNSDTEEDVANVTVTLKLPQISPVTVSVDEETNETRRMDSVNSSNDKQPVIMSVNATKSEYGKPRVSFLHGIGSEYKESVSSPNAIYAPGSDLFVSRSDSGSSSSSSSSDEQRKSRDLSSTSFLHDHAATTIAESSNTSLNKCPIVDKKDINDKMAINEETNYSNNLPTHITITTKTKPKVPAKPTKPPICVKTKPTETGHYAKPISKPIAPVQEPDDDENDPVDSDIYYSVANNSHAIADGAKTITPVNHYAESNIYQEISSKVMKELEVEQTVKGVARESKLAALAIELEQVRHSNGANTKRQAPAPPKVPDPPLEEPPSSLGRTPSPTDAPSHLLVLKSDSTPFSSASSTTSSSSQDTETGFGSWTLHGSVDDIPKSSKSKNSFLLTQYSKCKMLAMGYGEDGAKGKKRFSLKKLLKIGKDSEVPVTFDPNCPNPKAWKYSDHFERPRAKLEIIHPMDLENKNLTVNPGFDPLRTNSTSSFASCADSVSVRHSVSSDYGSYYSDTMSPVQESKGDGNYEYITPEQSEVDYCRGSVSICQMLSSGRGTPCSGEPSASTSPTPSRCSATSQASTLTYGSSKTSSGGALTGRPPKPPPPPRAHSLLPGTKKFNNTNGIFKFPISDGQSSSNGSIASEESESGLPPKPQAPRRQNRTLTTRSEYANLDGKSSSSPDSSEHEMTPPLEDCSTDTEKSESVNSSFEDNTYDTMTANTKDTEDFDDQNYQDVELPQDEESEEDTLRSATEISSLSSSLSQSDVQSLEVVSPIQEEQKHQLPEEFQEITKIPDYKTTTMILSSSEQKQSIDKPTLSRSRNPPLTKGPSRPPPIYSKPPNTGIPRENPWKTLEGSYTALASTNREVLIKLMDQGIKRRPNLLRKHHSASLQWEDFNLDLKRPAVVFAFGDKVIYDATLAKNSDCHVTLVITLQQHNSGLNTSGQLQYPVLCYFNDNIPNHLVFIDGSQNSDNDLIQSSVYVLLRSEITTIENFIHDLPEELTEELEKEICFILLQLIQGLKVLQAQGIEAIDASFQNLILAKTANDTFYTLVFLSDNFFDDSNDPYSSMSENCKISLCQYALMLIFQLFKVESSEEFALISTLKFSKPCVAKVFENTINLLSEEKAVSLSQAKTLLECFMWGVQTLIHKPDFDEKEADTMLHRWIDIEKSNCIKAVINSSTYVNSQVEFHTQFLIRSNVRNIKDIASHL